MRAIPWGFAALAVGGIAGAAIGASAAGKAAKTEAAAATQAADIQSAAADKASATQLQMFDKTQANEAPFLEAGGNALKALQAGIGIGPGSTGPGPLNAPYPGGPPPTYNLPAFTLDDFHESPGYNFQMKQGEDAVLNNASALGGVASGNTLKKLTQFGQGAANQDYWNAYNAYNANYNNQFSANNSNYWNNYNAYVTNQNQKFGQLETVAGSGQNAAANLGSLGSQVGASVGNNLITAGNAAGTGVINAGNASAAGTVGGATAVTNGINNLSQNYLLASALNSGSLGSGGFSFLGFGS